MRKYKLEVSELGAISLPSPTAPLAEQRRAVRAIRILYPDAKITLQSITRHPTGLVVRPLMTEGIRL